jgi:hypothetical protein
MTAKVLDLNSRSEHKQVNIMAQIKRRFPLLMYIFWILSGTAFYALYEGHPLHIALYQSTSVGWAIGWDLPQEEFHEDSRIGMIYSCFHNLIGVLFVGFIVMYIEIAVSKTTDNWILEMTNRQGVEYDSNSSSAMYRKVLKWVKLNKDRVKIYLICSGCFLLCILFGFYAVDSLGFAESCDMTLSTLSCGGYSGMPLHANKWAFIFLAIFTNVAVPLFLVAAGTLASIMMNTQDEKSFYKKIASPLTDVELKFMQYFGIEDGDGVLDKKEFLILIIIRIGNIKPGNVVDIHNHFNEITRNTDGTISYADILEAESQFSERSSISALRLMPLLLKPFHTSSGRQASSVRAIGDGEGSPGRVKKALFVKKKVQLRKISSIFKFSQKKSFNKTVPVNQGTMDEKEDFDEDQPTCVPRHEARETTSSRCTSPKQRWGNLIATPPQPSRGIFVFGLPFNKRQSRSRTAPATTGGGEDEDRPMVDQLRELKRHPVLVKENSNTTQPSPSGSFSSTAPDPSTPSGNNAPPVTQDTPPSATSQSFHEQHNVGTLRRSGVNKPNPFSLVREYSRQHWSVSPNLSPNKNSSRIPDVPDSSSSTAPPTDWGAEVRPPESSLAIGYSAAGRRKFSSKKDRQTSYERTVELLGKGRQVVLDFVARNRLKRHKRRLRRSTQCGLQKISEAHTALEKIQSFNNMLDDDAKLCSALGMLVVEWMHDGYVQAFVFWMAWLLLGGVFYSYSMDISFYRGFYMSVNVGYAIYWTTEEDSMRTKAFSVLNVILGQLVTTVAMAFFAGRLKQNWYAEAEEKAKLVTVNENSNVVYFNVLKILYFLKRNHVHCLSILWLAFGTLWSLVSVQWSFLDSLYFSITSLSTGGMWAIPENSPDSHYFIVAAFTSTGAPILCLSAGIFAYYLCRFSYHIDLVEAMHSPITSEELEMMQVLDIADDDLKVDKTEYVLLILIRIKAVQPELIAAVLAHFNAMDEVNSGSFTYEKLLAPPVNRPLSVKSVFKAMVKSLSKDADD